MPDCDWQCRFCLKPQSNVRKLFAGPGNVFICDECVRLCYDIMVDDGLEPKSAARHPQLDAMTVIEFYRIASKHAPTAVPFTLGMLLDACDKRACELHGAVKHTRGAMPVTDPKGRPQ